MTRATYGEGSVREVKPGRWELRWSEGRDAFTGKHLRRSATISARNVTEARKELRKRSGIRTQSSAITLGELLEITLPALPIADITRETYGYALAHLTPAARSLPAASIDVLQAKAVVEGLTRICGAQTVRKAHAAIMACWREAHLRGWVTQNPWRGQRLPSVPASAGRALTDNEVATLRAACEPGIEALHVDVHLETGARPGEVVGIQYSDIDHDELLVTVTDTKHAGARRTVSISAELSAAIRAHQHTMRTNALAGGAGMIADPWLFAMEPDGSRPWTVNYAGSFRWPRLRERAGLPDEVRLYDLRHTHNSWLEAGGIDVTSRSARIGNSPAVNARTYSHPLSDRAASVVAAERLRRG